MMMGSGDRSNSVDIADASTRVRASARVHAFDWLRIIAFGLLILFHAGQPYNPFYTWHVTDADKSNLLWDLVGWMRFWRLHLLFFVSGFGTYFALRRLDGVAFLRERSVRLWVPLLFGMAIVCPPQVWVERVTQHGYTDGFLTFFVHDAFTHGTYPAGNITWNHLWFLPYLLLMTVVLTPLLISLRDSGWLEAKRFGALTMLRSVALLSSGVILPILATSLLLIWPNQTNGLFDDWGWFAIWSTYFFQGFIFAGLRKEVIPLVQRTRWIFLCLVPVCYAILESGVVSEAEGPGQLVLRVLAWFAILALSGFALVHLNRDSAAKRYLNAAIYPVYVLHQTLIVLVAYWLLETGWPVEVKFTFVAIATLLGCGLLYEGVIKRLGRSGVLFGLKHQPKSGFDSPAAVSSN